MDEEAKGPREVANAGFLVSPLSLLTFVRGHESGAMRVVEHGGATLKT
jgi:hypothetical protein